MKHLFSNGGRETYNQGELINPISWKNQQQISPPSQLYKNRINLIFLHISFLFIKIKHNNMNSHYKEFYQKMFDIVFKKIELNMREVGHGDVTVNKNMKFLVKIFYDVLLNCENYNRKSLNEKKLFLLKHLRVNYYKKSPNYNDLTEYFDKYQTFCLDLSSDKVLKGELEFNYQ